MNLKLVKSEFEAHAKEPLTVERLSGVLYAYGSEVAVLRLHCAYRHMGNKANSGFSTNLNLWFFRLDPM